MGLFNLFKPIKKSEISQEAQNHLNKIEKDALGFRFFLKTMCEQNLENVIDRYNNLKSVFENAVLFNDDSIVGLNKLGDVINSKVTLNNIEYNGLIYYKVYDSEFDYNELKWIRRLKNGILDEDSEYYNYNRLDIIKNYDKGVLIKETKYKLSFDKIIGDVDYIIEYQNEKNYKKISYSDPDHYKIENYIDDKLNGEWLEFETVYSDNFPSKPLKEILSSKKFYKDGLETGKWEWYDEKEEVIKTQYWKDGKNTFLRDTIQALNLGNDYSDIIDILGNPDYTKTSISNGKNRLKIYYGKSINRLGNDSYSFEITFIDNKLIGFKELNLVGQNIDND